MDFTPPIVNLGAALPAVIISAWAMGLLIVDLWIPREHKQRTALLALLGVLVALVVAALQWGQSAEAFPGTGMFTLDNFTTANTVIVLLAAGLTILLSVNFLQRVGALHRGEFYVLLLFSATGMILMAAASDLIMVFLALELLSIPLYVLAGLLRPNAESEESALKYFLLGAFASAFLVYGIALVYGATGSTHLAKVVVAVGALAGGTGGAWWPVLLAGTGLLLVGFGFKIAAVPFHMWTPDVYQGAPTPVTAFMSVGAKVGGFAALLRVFLTALPAISWAWWPAVAVIAGLTMIVGNVMALVQPNLKRMLGYSSIAHAGYILIAVAAAGAYPSIAPQALGAALLYLLAYTFTNLGAFAVAIAVEQDAPAYRDNPAADAPPSAPFGSLRGGGQDADKMQTPRGVLIREFAGLGKSHTGLALVMALFMLSLTGVPPTGGFTGKFALFSVAIAAATGAGGPVATGMIVLTLVGVLTSVISAFFYLGVVVTMFMREGQGVASARGLLVVALVVTVLGVLWLGLAPSGVLGLMQGSGW
jgi:NADH-quinone oxidoreductase subunit N